MIYFIYDLLIGRIKIFDKKALIFIHIPKTGGLAITKSLYRLEIGHHSTYYFEQRYGKIITHNMCNFFCVVRNPLDRFESAINYLPRSEYKTDQEFFTKHKHYFDNENWDDAIKDSEFISYIHFIPQKQFIKRHQNIKIWHISELDELYTYYKIIPDKKCRNQRKINKYKLTEKQRKIVRSYYESDFALMPNV